VRTETFSTAGELLVSLEVPAGLIELHPVDADETVVQVDGERDPDDVSIRLEPHGTAQRLRVEHRGRRLGRFAGGDLHVVVRLPERADVEASTGAADVIVHGTIGSIAVRSGSGDVTFQEVAGDVTVKVASGDVLGRSVGGDLTMHGASGDLLVSSVGGGLTARTASGDVKLGAVAGSVRITTVSGDVRVDSMSVGTAEVRAVSGDVEIGVDPGVRVFLDLSTASGDATSDLPMDDGAGGPADLELHVGTVSGDIAVHRARPTRAAAGG
jgi:DUF4097 and DUF4098 domain-containing protein YvlB